MVNSEDWCSIESEEGQRVKVTRCGHILIWHEDAISDNCHNLQSLWPEAWQYLVSRLSVFIPSFYIEDYILDSRQDSPSVVQYV